MQSRKIPNIYVKRPIFLTEKEVWDLVLKNGYLHLLNYEHKRDNLALPKNFRNVACSFYKYCYYSCEKSKGKIYLKNFGEKEISLSFKGGEDKREMNIDFVNLGEKEFFLLLNHFHLLYIKSPKRLYQKEFKEMAHGAFI